MSHFTITTFLATTATAVTPLLIVYNMPQKKTQLSSLSSLPKPRPLAALRDAREQSKVGSEFSLI